MLISILPLIVITIVTCFGLMIMHIETNVAYGQWIIPSSELKNAYKQGYLKSNVTVIDDGKGKQQK